MAATRHDRGNAWTSRAWLNDDRALIAAKAAKRAEATFQAESAAARGQVVVVPFADRYWELVDSLSAAKLRSLLAKHFSCDFMINRQMILFVKW